MSIQLRVWGFATLLVFAALGLVFILTGTTTPSQPGSTMLDNQAVVVLLAALLGASLAFGFQWWLLRWQRGKDNVAAIRAVFWEAFFNRALVEQRQEDARDANAERDIFGPVTDEAFKAYMPRLSEALTDHDMAEVFGWYTILPMYLRLAEGEHGLQATPWKEQSTKTLTILRYAGWGTTTGPSSAPKSR